jgi:hypothetical protein
MVMFGIQIPQQFEMMERFGGWSSMFFDATFDTNQSKVHPFLPLYEMFVPYYL